MGSGHAAQESWRRSVEPRTQALRGAVGLELCEGLGLDLADALAGDAELYADLLERARVPVGQPVAQLDDRALALREQIEDALELLALNDPVDLLDGRRIASVSAMKSASRVSPSSAIGLCRLVGSWLILRISRTFSGVMPISAAISSGVGSRPMSCSSWRCTRMSLLMFSTMCTGMRMVRA